MIPLPPFEPDKSPYNPKASDNVINALPKVDGWGPMASLVPVSDALAAAPKGGVAATSTGGGTTIYVGTATDLYELDTTSSPYSWTSRSKSATAYSVGSSDRWQFVVYGDRLIAVNGTDTPQYVDLSSGGAFADLPNAPISKYIEDVGDFLMMGHFGSAENNVRWNGLNDSEFWTNGERHADQQEIPTGGVVQGIKRIGQGALVFMERAIHGMQFAPASGYTFTRSVVNPERGAFAPYSIVQVDDGRVFYYTESGFYEGIQGRPIGSERVNLWFDAKVQSGEGENIVGVEDPENRIVWWMFTASGDMQEMLGYDYELDRWCYSQVPIVDIMSLRTAGVTWDGLDALFATMDDVTVPFDSRLLKGGLLALAGFDSDNKLGFFNGASLAATLDTGIVKLNKRGRSQVNRTRVNTDADGATVSLATVENYAAIPDFQSAVSKSSRSGTYPLRGDAELHKFRLNIPAAEDWTHASAFEPEFRPTGGL